MRADQRVGEGIDIVGIDDQRVLELLRRAGERAQHEHAVLVVSRRDELLGDQVHAVVQRADDAEVREAVERDEAAAAERRLVVVDRPAARRPACRAAR